MVSPPQFTLCAAAPSLSMTDRSDLVLQQHRIYLLRHFEVESTGDIVCAGFARSDPEKIIAARFPNPQITFSWQEIADTSKLPWPLEVISFQAVRTVGRRFRFSLNCIDFQREWESDWPEFIPPTHNAFFPP